MAEDDYYDDDHRRDGNGDRFSEHFIVDAVNEGSRPPIQHTKQPNSRPSLASPEAIERPRENFTPGAAEQETVHVAPTDHIEHVVLINRHILER